MRRPAVQSFLVLIIAVTSSAMHAQSSAKLDGCMAKASTQMTMNECAGAELSRADAELNAVYKQLLQLAAKDDLATAKIKAAERAWIIYRDATMEAIYPEADKQAQYGSIYPMQASLDLAEITQKQVAELRSISQAYKGDEK